MGLYSHLKIPGRFSNTDFLGSIVTAPEKSVFSNLTSGKESHDLQYARREKQASQTSWFEQVRSFNSSADGISDARRSAGVKGENENGLGLQGLRALVREPR
jgi:hypothetical protein